MPWSYPSNWASSLLGPNPIALGLALIVALSIPLLLHFLVFRSSSTTTLPSFLLTGPSASGKTALLTLFERGQPAATRVSQSPLTVEVSLPVSTETASSRYRSVNDPSLQVHKRFLLVDTPGHGKLRHYAIDTIIKPQHLKGIIYVVDAANISPGSSELREAAEYLHDILLLLQKRSAAANTSRSLKEIPVLVATNKMDLFTALPTAMVKTVLEQEITNLRASRAKALPDSGIAMSDMDSSDERAWLGDGGEGKFEFLQMEEASVPVTIAGGNVSGSDEADVGKWWDWIGSNL